MNDKDIEDCISESKLLEDLEEDKEKEVGKKQAIERIRYILKCMKIEKRLLTYIPFGFNYKGSLVLHNPKPQTGWWLNG
jgi:hypothetical protein